MNVLRNQNNPRDILFKHFPQIFGTNDYTHLYNAIYDNKHWRDEALADLYKTLDAKLRNIFSGDSRASLISLLKIGRKIWIVAFGSRYLQIILESFCRC